MSDNYLDQCCAIAEGLDEDDYKYRMAAIICDSRGNVLSRGTNSYTKTHPLQARYATKCFEGGRIFRHAEIHAISRLGRDASPKRIYIGRVNRNGTRGLAKPCRICEKAIKEAGITEVCYTV